MEVARRLLIGQADHVHREHRLAIRLWRAGDRAHQFSRREGERRALHGIFVTQWHGRDATQGCSMLVDVSVVQRAQQVAPVAGAAKPAWTPQNSCQGFLNQVVGVIA